MMNSRRGSQKRGASGQHLHAPHKNCKETQTNKRTSWVPENSTSTCNKIKTAAPPDLFPASTADLRACRGYPAVTGGGQAAAARQSEGTQPGRHRCGGGKNPEKSPAGCGVPCTA